MVQETTNPRLARLERQMAELKRLLTLGLIGADVDALQSQLNRQQGLLGALLGDRTIGNVLLGDFPSGISSTSFRRADGDYYPAGSLNILVQTSTKTINDGDIYAMPFYMPNLPNVIDELAFNVSGTAEAGKSARVGIYEDNGSVYPGRLLFDVGEASVASTGLKKFSVDESIPRGLVWIVMTADSSTPSPPGALYESYSNTDAGAWVILGQDSTDLSPYVAWRVNSAYGPLPAVYPAGAAKRQNAPVVWASFKSGGWS